LQNIAQHVTVFANYSENDYCSMQWDTAHALKLGAIGHN